jgi:hypothetical protein
MAIVPGAEEYDLAWIQLRSWNGAATWEEALNTPLALAGESIIFQNRTGQGDPFPGFPVPAPLLAPSFTLFPVRPRLRISASEASLVTAWSTNFLGFEVEYTEDLLTQPWSPLPEPVRVQTNEFQVHVSRDADRRLYRLRKAPRRPSMGDRPDFGTDLLRPLGTDPAQSAAGLCRWNEA